MFDLPVSRLNSRRRSCLFVILRHVVDKGTQRLRQIRIIHVHDSLIHIKWVFALSIFIAYQRIVSPHVLSRLQA